MSKITLGAEEELQIVSPFTCELVSHDFERGRLLFPDVVTESSKELHKAVLEVKTSVCSSVDELISQLASARKLAISRATEQGQHVLAAGAHPFSDWRLQTLHIDVQGRSDYADTVERYGDVVRSLLSFGLHVHVGLPQGVPAFPIFNSLRNVLAPLLGLSASSPFYDGRLTGLSSWRHSLLDRMPRMGTPEIWKSTEEYVSYLEILRKMGTISREQGFWEDLRLHHTYGTLEIRVCDATSALSTVWLIAALIQCEVQTLVGEYHLGTLPTPMHRAGLDENKWRIRRYGLEASLVDWNSLEVLSLSHYFESWLVRLAPVAKSLGLYDQMRAEVALIFKQGVSSDRQRSWATQGASLKDIVSRLVQETAEPLQLSRLS
jgi:carboxylate-amine ligase